MVTVVVMLVPADCLRQTPSEVNRAYRTKLPHGRLLAHDSFATLMADPAN
jgi:hypothetical protein